MSIATLILGPSGQGKTTSLSNMDPTKTLLIQTVGKSLPWEKPEEKGWAVYDAEHAPKGNIFVTDNSAKMCALMQRTSRPIIVIDDFNYGMSNEFMRRSMERGYDKFTEIQRSAWDVLVLMNTLPSDTRVYVLAHSWVNDAGFERMKTIGKMLDEKDTPEGRFPICLKALRKDGAYWFSTQTSGTDPVKSPRGMFADELIPNDLAAVDARICEYWGLA